MAHPVTSIQAALVAHWNTFWDRLRQVNSGVQVTPDDAYTLFQVDYSKSNASEAWFDIQPVVINLPERGDQTRSDLFVVIEGHLRFCVATFKSSKILESRGFATHVGYFRLGSGTLQHVFGAHYDFDIERLAHPIFHAQLKSYAASFDPQIRKHYGFAQAGEDRVQHLLQNVRLPIAHLDFFSMLVHLAADHLIWASIGNEELAAFNEVLEVDQKMVGASKGAQRLCDAAGIPCHRASHWYNQTQRA